MFAVFFPDLITDENFGLHQARSFAVRRVNLLIIGLNMCCCKFVPSSTHPGASTYTCDSELCGGFVGDSLGFILSHSSLFCSSTLMRLRHWIQRGKPTAVKWKGWDVLRLSCANNRTTETYCCDDSSLCNQPKHSLITSGSRPVAQRTRRSYAMVSNIARYF